MTEDEFERIIVKLEKYKNTKNCIKNCELELECIKNSHQDTVVRSIFSVLSKGLPDPSANSGYSSTNSLTEIICSVQEKLIPMLEERKAELETALGDIKIC